jgi:anti-sigma factor RsiW
MTGTSCGERELLLHGLADGELDAANALALEEHLKSCEGCTAAYREILKQRELLKAPGLRLTAPSFLRERILAEIAAAEAATGAPAVAPIPVARHKSWRWQPAQALAAFSAMALAASLILFLNTGGGPESIDNQIAAAHVRSLLVSHLTDVASSDQHTVKPWFLGKLDFAPPVADLAGDGFPLIGGRLDYIGERAVPALIYKRNAHVINLFIWPAGELKSAGETLGGYHILSWEKNGFTFTAVSDVNAMDLRSFERALNEALG